jgi:hypothetical protein
MSTIVLPFYLLHYTRDLPEERNDEIEHASPEGRVHFKYSLQTGLVLRLNSKRKAQGAHPDSGTLHRGFPELLPLILTEASDTVELDHRVRVLVILMIHKRHYRALELRFARKTFPRPRDVGIPD